MKMKPNMVLKNRPKMEMICKDPKGKQFPLHEWSKGFGYWCCANCGLDNPDFKRDS